MADNKKNPRAKNAVGDDPFEDMDLAWLDPEAEAADEDADEAPEIELAPLPAPPPELAPPAEAEDGLFAWLEPGIPAGRDGPEPPPEAEASALTWLRSRERPAASVDADEADAALDAWLAEEDES